MVPVRVDGVAPVRDLVPELAGDELVLRASWPVAIAIRVTVVRVQHFLQEQDVRSQAAQALAQLVDHEAPPVRKTLVDVVRCDSESRRCSRCHDVDVSACACSNGAAYWEG